MLGVGGRPKSSGVRFNPSKPPLKAYLLEKSIVVACRSVSEGLYAVSALRVTSSNGSAICE